MRWFKVTATELFGLFVDDGSLVLAILIWVILLALLLPQIGIPMVVKGPLLAIGLAVILIESATRRSRH